MSLASGSLPATDRSYLAQLVSARTGQTAADAQQRVTDVLAQIDQAKAKARKRRTPPGRRGSPLLFSWYCH